MEREKKMLIAAILAIVVIISAVVGVLVHMGGTNTPGGELQMQLNTPKAMVSFGSSAVNGVTIPEPEDLTITGRSEVKPVSVLVGDNNAEYLNCSQQVYSNYELGQRDIPTDVLIRLADFYHVSVDYLLGLTNNPKRNK